VKDETIDPERMCRQCENRKLRDQYDPMVGLRIAWLQRMRFYLDLGISRDEMGITLDDIGDMYALEIETDSYKNELMKLSQKKTKQAGRRTKRHGRIRR
jgi:hypothetical protein